MSGHNKWSTIKNKKAKTDAARGKIFTKIGRELAVAVKTGGPDPATNSKLRDIIAKAKANNMPNDNINRTIKKYSGDMGDVNYEENIYEGYGPGGVAMIIETLTDNKNRTVSDVRHALAKNGGSLGNSGCVGWMFEKKGLIVIEDEDAELDEDEVTMAALEAGAEDIDANDGVYEITTDPAEFSAVREALENMGYTFASAEITMIPTTTTAVDADTAKAIYSILDMLDDNDDVQNVYHNAELPDEE